MTNRFLLSFVLALFLCVSVSSHAAHAGEPPEATNLSAAESYTEDTTLNLVDIVVTDGDSANVTARLTLSDHNAGSLNTGTSGSTVSTYVAGTGVWTAAGPIADVNALLASVSFIPATDRNGNFTITTSVDDGDNAPIMGSKAFTGTPVNDAPVLNTSKSPTLVDVNEDAGAPSGVVGTSVGNLVDFVPPSGGLDNVTDADSAPQSGVAIIAINSGSITCFYSLNSGTTWNTFGSVSNTSARLLSSAGTNRIYCQPTGASGTYSDALTFRAWDRTSGTDGGTANTASNGGTSAFSSATDTVSLTVIAPDTTAPNTSITPVGSYTVDSTTATFVLTSDESATFECSMDDESYVSCTSPYVTPELSAGAHTFTARAIDLADNVDNSPATYSWTVYDSLPVVVETAPVDGDSNVPINTPIVFTFSDPVSLEIRSHLITMSQPCDFGCPDLNGVWSKGNRVLTYTKVDGDFLPDTTYSVRLVVNNNELADDLAAISFTTGIKRISTPKHSSGGGQMIASIPVSSTSGSSVFLFNHDLKVGMTDPDVLLLQRYLNAHGFMVAQSGAGSVGSETNFFGAFTKAAVAALQKANGITPVVGYFGPLTRAFVNR